MIGKKLKLGISTCLLGENVRYDGGHKLDHYLKETLGRYVEWVPVCPEVEMGLPVPREAMRLVGRPSSPGLVTARSGIDYTGRMVQWAEGRLHELEEQGLCGFIFKSGSPSSGMRGVKVYGESGIPSRAGVGIFARAFMGKFPLLPVEDDGRLQDPQLRENFIGRVFVYRRWHDAVVQGGSFRDLIAFHTEHKLMVLSHSPRHYSELGRLVADGKKHAFRKLCSLYFGTLMEALKLAATTSKHTNVLQHVMGYFKRQLSPDEKQELIEVIGSYHRGLVPLIVPVTLLNHYARKFREPYLLRQYYLNPHPLELMLRNHV